MSKMSGLIKEVGSSLGDYFFGTGGNKNPEGIDCMDMVDIVAGKTSLTALSLTGLALIASTFFTENTDNWKYVFGIGTISIIEPFRYYFCKLSGKENRENKSLKTSLISLKHDRKS